VWDVATRQEICSLPVGTGIIWSVAFSPDGKHIASGGPGTTAWLWNIDTLKGIECLQVSQCQNHFCLAFSPDGKILAIGDECDKIMFWEIDTAKKIESPSHTNIYSVCFSPDGKQLASVGPDKIVLLWDMDTLDETKRFTHADGVQSLAFSPDNGQNCTMGIFWGVSKVKCCYTLFMAGKFKKPQKIKSYRENKILL